MPFGGGGQGDPEVTCAPTAFAFAFAGRVEGGRRTRQGRGRGGDENGNERFDSRVAGVADARSCSRTGKGEASARGRGAGTARGDRPRGPRSDAPSGKATLASHASPVWQLALAEASASARETRAASATSASARIAPRGRDAPATRENIADGSTRRTGRNRASTRAVVRSPRAHLRLKPPAHPLTPHLLARAGPLHAGSVTPRFRANNERPPAIGSKKGPEQSLGHRVETDGG